MCTLKIRIQVKIYNYTAVLFVLFPVNVWFERNHYKACILQTGDFLTVLTHFLNWVGFLLYENDPGDLTLEQEEQGFDVFYHRERYVYL